MQIYANLEYSVYQQHKGETTLVEIPAQPMIRGQKVWLRPLEKRDLEPLALAFSESDSAHTMAFAHPWSSAEFERWFAGVVEGHGKSGYFFAICPLGSNEFIGSANLAKLLLPQGRAEFQICLSRSSIGQGYGTDALEAIVDFGFGMVRLERIELFVAAANTGGIRSYQKAGFMLEGTLRKHYWNRGRLHDSKVMSLLREEWAALERPKSWELSAKTATLENVPLETE